MHIDPHAARQIAVLGLDVDGVLTDNGLWIGESAGHHVELKRFDIQDGLGLVLLRSTSIDVVWMSARSSRATELRAKELGILEVHQLRGQHKHEAMGDLLASRHLDWSQLAFVGDDLADLGVLRLAGVSIAVQNAVDAVRAEADHVTEAPGGSGAVREVIDALLVARGEWDTILATYRGVDEA